MTAMPPRLRPHPVLAFATLLLFVACTQVRLVGPYDEMIDNGTGQVHTKLVAFVTRMESLAGQPAGTYANNAQFYTDIAAEVSTLRLRAQALPKDDITVKMLDELAGNVERLRQLHQIGGDKGLPEVLGKPALSALETNCGEILVLEVKKKRGESN